MRRSAWLAVASVALVLAGCSSSSSVAATSTDTWGTQSSAGGQSGLNALIAAARAEGQLNVIGLPADWAHYGFIVNAFKAKYGIKVNNLDPNAVSDDEIAALKAGSKAKPDVLDLNMTVALANAKLFAPYKVVGWDGIPSLQKNSDGLWYQDYGGYMAIGWDSANLPAITTVDSLLLPAFKGRVALKGDPTIDDGALSAVMMVALNEGGSLDNIGPGVDFFHKLRLKGNYLAVVATNTTVTAHQTQVVMDWEYLSHAHIADIPTWKVIVPGVSLLGNFFAQAISKAAPHPAAARLWEEYLYSTDGQNEWLRAGMRPVELASMQSAGTVDPEANAALPAATGTPLFMSPAQITAARTYLGAHWAKAVA